jgi:hypothetical protein
MQKQKYKGSQKVDCYRAYQSVAHYRSLISLNFILITIYPTLREALAVMETMSEAEAPEAQTEDDDGDRTAQASPRGHQNVDVDVDEGVGEEGVRDGEENEVVNIIDPDYVMKEA